MDDLLPWLTLKSVPGIGNLLFLRLVNHFGSPRQVLAAPVASLEQVPGISHRMAVAITRQRPSSEMRQEIERCRQNGFHIISLHDDRYPALLRHIPDPPPVLYCHGRMEGTACHIAVVGSRKATGYGLSNARQLSQGLAARGVTVVSGMARGIDTAAHTGALLGGGRTVAVLGSGLERIYPRENRKLFQRIAESGAVVSEFPLDAGPEAHHFPQRNRIISGMSLGTLVVEAAKRSGALITARLAAEQGREVFAVPGSIQAAMARGAHDLIRQGATLVEAAEDIIKEVAPQIGLKENSMQTVDKVEGGAVASFSLSGSQQQIWDAIGPYPIHIDDLSRCCGLDMSELSAVLCQLELKGAVRQEAGKFFSRISASDNND
ncbi:MAG: DNA-processing protein DprA [Desulfobacteraceae bacterium]